MQVETGKAVNKKLRKRESGEIKDKEEKEGESRKGEGEGVGLIRTGESQIDSRMVLLDFCESLQSMPFWGYVFIFSPVQVMQGNEATNTQVVTRRGRIRKQTHY